MRTDKKDSDRIAHGLLHREFVKGRGRAAGGVKRRKGELRWKKSMVGARLLGGG